MMTFIVGREGNQPFTILQGGVGRQHLQVTVPDQMDGVWIIQDLNSTNGTFVLQDDGTFVRVTGTYRGTWHTVVRMGPDNMYGHRFWLCQLLQQDPSDFSMQFSYLNKVFDEMQAEKNQLAQKAVDDKRNQLIIRSVITLVLCVGCYFIEGLGNFRFMLMPLIGVIVSFISLKKNSATQLSRDYKTILVCPNGNCAHPLSEHSLKLGKCPTCKAHI